MISAIVPYWNRRELLQGMVRQWREFYKDIDYEIVVCDDGSQEPPDPEGIVLVTLPAKAGALSPCVPTNRAVEASKGEMILLTGAEVRHDGPILRDLAAELGDAGPKGYVSAAVMGEHGWYAHSKVDNEKLCRAAMPPQAQLHFCALMYRKFYDEVGGMDEDYRRGFAYDDNDFVWTLHQAGVDFRMRDDLTATHITTRTKWPMSKLHDNKALFEKKWAHLIS